MRPEMVDRPRSMRLVLPGAVRRADTRSWAGHQAKPWTCLGPCGWRGRRRGRSRQLQALPAPPTRSQGRGSTASFLEEADKGFDTESEVFQIEFLIGGVEIVIRQAEAHHDAGKAEMASEIAHDGDGAAGADEDRILAPNFVQSAGGGLDIGVVHGNQARLAGVNQAHLDVDAGWGDFLHIGLVEG